MSNPNNCQNFDSCRSKEKETLQYPVDEKSLYADKIYDNQTANKRCYQKNPTNILEGFGFGCELSMDKIIKLTIVVLLVIAFVFLARDVFTGPKQMVGGFVALSTQATELTAISLIDNLYS